MKMPLPNTRKRISNALGKVKQALTPKFMTKKHEQTPAQTQKKLDKNPHLNRFLKNDARYQAAQKKMRENAALGVMPTSALVDDTPSSRKPTVQSPKFSIEEQGVEKNKNNLVNILKQHYPSIGTPCTKNGNTYQDMSDIDGLISNLSNQDINDVINHINVHKKDFNMRTENYTQNLQDNQEALNYFKTNHTNRMTTIQKELQTTQNLSPKDELIKHMQIAQRTKLISEIDKILKQKP